MKEPSWNNDDFENGKICLSNAKELFFSNTQLAIKYSELAIDYFKKYDKSLCDLAHCYYIKACGLWCTNREEANLYYIESIKAHILGSQTESYKKNRFYKFVGIKNRSKHRFDSLANLLNVYSIFLLESIQYSLRTGAPQLSSPPTPICSCATLTTV